MSQNVKVNLNASLQDDGSVLCDVTCNGQEARLTFTGTDVLLDVKEPAAPAEARILT